jgi:FKBP12-rapamycin complex-associated protein
MLAIAVGPSLTKYMHELLDYMFAGGLTEPLRRALVDLSVNIPPLLRTIQDRLLNILSVILFSSPYNHPGTPARLIQTSSATTMEGEVRDNAPIILALDTLGSFDFKGHALHEVVHECAILYLDDENTLIRKSAAITTSHLLAQDPVCYQTSTHSLKIVSDILERLLSIAIADQGFYI